MPYSGSQQAKRKIKESKQFFTENFNLGETELFIKKVLLGAVLNHIALYSAHGSHSWSLSGGFSFLLNISRLFLHERTSQSGPACAYILVYYCIISLPGDSQLSIHLFASPQTTYLPLCVASIAKSVRSLVFSLPDSYRNQFCRGT